MLKPTTTTKFAIARDLTLISDGYDDIGTAKRQLQHVEENMRSVGLEPDVQIVEVIVKTTLGKPKVWKDESQKPVVDEPAAEVVDEPAAEVVDEEEDDEPANSEPAG